VPSGEFVRPVSFQVCYGRRDKQEEWDRSKWWNQSVTVAVRNNGACRTEFDSCRTCVWLKTSWEVWSV